jgi:hypothetical protein
MNAESKIDPSKPNAAGSGATGLIQFMPKIAKDLGTTTSALAKMSAEEQLVYVEKYLTTRKTMAGLSKDAKIGAGTLYALVFLPGRIQGAKNKNGILTTAGENYYAANKNAFDKKGKGYITIDDLASLVESHRA